MVGWQWTDSIGLFGSIHGLMEILSMLAMPIVVSKVRYYVSRLVDRSVTRYMDGWIYRLTR